MPLNTAEKAAVLHAIAQLDGKATQRKVRRAAESALGAPRAALDAKKAAAKELCELEMSRQSAEAHRAHRDAGQLPGHATARRGSVGPGRHGRAAAAVPKPKPGAPPASCSSQRRCARELSPTARACPSATSASASASSGGASPTRRRPGTTGRVRARVSTATVRDMET